MAADKKAHLVPMTVITDEFQGRLNRRAGDVVGGIDTALMHITRRWEAYKTYLLDARVLNFTPAMIENLEELERLLKRLVERSYVR